MTIRKYAIALCILTALCLSAGTARADAHWGYTGHNGPPEWGTMSPDFSACKLGKFQSPIDIRDAKPADLPAIKFDIAVGAEDHRQWAHYRGQLRAWSSIDVVACCELVQFHFHKPSEEKIDGKAHAMVAHLVHKNAEGKLAVVAVLLDKGGASDLIDTLWKNIPPEKGKENAVDGTTIDVSKLLPDKRDYYTFQGSLTTPPCSEGVTWFVLKTPVKIADAEIASFAKIYPLNARPTQPTNGRSIQTTK